MNCLNYSDSVQHYILLIFIIPFSSGKNGSQCSFHKVSKGQQRFTSSEALLEMELSSYINLEDISPTKNSKESWINLEESCYIVDDPNDEKRLKKLKNLFPGHKDEELLNVLEFHGGSLDDAVAAMEAFSSPKQCPKKTACKIKTGKQERGSGANEVIIIDDHNDSSMERNTSSGKLILHDTVQYNFIILFYLFCYRKESSI